MSEAPAAPAPSPDPTTPGKKPMSNLSQRLLFGVLGAVLLLGSVWYSAWSFALFFGAVQMRMLWEFYRMMRHAGYKPAALLGGGISLVLFGGTYVFHALADERFDIQDRWTQQLIIYCAVGVIIILPILLILREMYAWPRKNQDINPFANVGINLLGLLYVSLPMSLLNVVAFTGNGQYDYRRVFALLLLVWSSDIGAYAAGKTFGKHKLAPKISPGKTWEGAIGGFLLTLAMGWALGYLLPELSVTYRLVVAAVVAVFGPLGDLAESMLKRSVGVKDSGRIMPGHGGLLDRFDAFLFILPVLALLQLLAG
ncbi:phosphatidate cytidylyltransferase [Hymenobacter sp. BT186]|uniref:Phosphatidate cytidylyltransferase n=1 Tax=Hymenobacter telluris TaxID=2816474 RepID=A0A939EYF4_9BACT|nr:phosphatidate cytidylyltransferase [Hymenobacter telluris]MBO0359509.1 phosphatidate cytidylyltransferase [Hymenobacter telluris]MBW3375535.1 phosphatidate cytidylyltransferase [Hymenobacter norwichensis]